LNYREDFFTEEVDFTTPILQSKWRRELVSLNDIFSQVPFLNFNSPNFIPGYPERFSSPSKKMMWESDYRFQFALYETLLWMNEIDQAKQLLPELQQNSFTTFGAITVHCYSKATKGEHAMYDFWNGFRLVSLG
jgi:hypothetical protein